MSSVLAEKTAVPASSTIYLGMDVHKDSITVAVLPEGAKAPTRVERLSSDLQKLRRFLDRIAKEGELRSCYEASGAGYVLQRAIREWGYECEVIAPSLIPKKPGVQRKHDKRDAADLARLYRAGELTPVRIPSEAEERVRDIVRLRDTLQHEVMKSRHYVLKFLARRGFVYREGKNWTDRHFAWLKKLQGPSSPLSPEDEFVFSEYLALLEYKLQRRDELDKVIGKLALEPYLATPVNHLQCFKGLAVHAAMVLATEIVDWRRFEKPTQLYAYLGLSRACSEGRFLWAERKTGVDHESGQRSLPPRADTGSLELSAPAQAFARANATTGRNASFCRRSFLEGPAAPV